MYIPSDSVFRNFQAGSPKITNEKPKNEKLKKALVLGAAAGGLLLGLRLVGRQQGINTFTKEGYKKINHGFKSMTTLAGFSLLGGTSAGVALDRKEAKPKLREGIQQLVGNIILPAFAVTQGEKLFSKYEDYLKLPLLKSGSKVAEKTNAVLKALPKVAATGFLLGVGLFVGNKIANFVNNLIFANKETRKFEIRDLSGHVDDLCLAATLVSRGTEIGTKTSALIAPALIVPGYVAGTKTSAHKH